MHLAIAVILMLCAGAFAQTTRPADSFHNVPISSGRAASTQPVAGIKTTTPDQLDLKRVSLALGIVMVLILVAYGVWKRMGSPGAVGKSTQSLEIVSRLNVSPKQQVLLLRVGRRCVLVGNSGTQMNPLCEIDNEEEVAALLGTTAVEKPGSMTAVFNEVLGGAEREFEEVEKPKMEDEEKEIATTRQEIGSLMEKVKSLSKQFQRT